jgi:hypothetical protein
LITLSLKKIPTAHLGGLTAPFAQNEPAATGTARQNAQDGSPAADQALHLRVG